ncbi:MAG: polysaccharide deacetylase family protein [Saprospiraceae bacterium]
MKNQRIFLGISISIFCLLSIFSLPAQSISWPDGNKAALSLSFDDARLSNVDVGTAFFNKHGAKVTFYVVPASMKPRLAAWQQAVKDGHEIGNHTLVHPCSGNFEWSRDKALEGYNLPAMRQELLSANQQIKDMLGVEPVSFAYSCGQTYVGRGRETQSYVPLVAELFESGRGWLDEASNDPLFADLAQLQGIEMDGKDFETAIKPILEAAKEAGNWVVLAGHEIGTGGNQTTLVAMLEQLMAYVQQEGSGIWMAPVGTVAAYVKEKRAEVAQQLAANLTFSATFDKGFEADLAMGDKHIFTADDYDLKTDAKMGMSKPDVMIAQGQGRFGDALAFKKKNDAALFFQSKGNVNYQKENWSGTISLWLSLDPEQDLAPGYCDPIQLTDVAYNDAALWVDFSDKNPRSFRMGVYGDLKVWNPKDIAPDENPAFQERLLPASDRPFGKGIWTHVVISFKDLNSADGTATFYINGKKQGSRSIPEPFSWELEKANIFLGLNYVGLMDEIAVFKEALSEREVKLLYHLPEGLGTLLQTLKK